MGELIILKMFFFSIKFLSILGFDRLLQNIINEWKNDITRNQIPQIVGGVGPLHSLRQLSKSKDLIYTIYNFFSVGLCRAFFGSC